MADSRASVQHALDRFTSCRPYERQARMVALMSAGVALRDEAEALNTWLNRAWGWLDAHPDHADFAKREARLLAEIQRYQAMHDLLGKALVAIARDKT